ncbi:serum paraoxonase/arylesterase 1-like [Glandiceps talaboti]
MLRQVICLVVISVLATRIAQILYLMGFHKTIYNHQPGPCRVIPGIDVGSEDITVSSHGLAFISSGLRSKQSGDPSRRPPNIRGRIFLFDFNYPEKNVVELNLNGEFDRENFYPHGISLYEDKNSGEIRLFVVNHHISNQERIEIFKFEDRNKSLTHLRTVTGNNIYSVNDVLAVAPESFYYTNDAYFKSAIGKQLEVFSNVAWGTIGFYDGEDRIVISGCQFANGINHSPDGRYVYVSSPIQEQIMVFERRKDNSLQEIQRINVYTGVDNIEVDKQTGDLWIGCHPVIHMMFSHGQNVSNKAGTQVLRIHFNSNNEPYSRTNIREVFMDDGSLISGSSVASFYGNKLLIGTVFDKMALCEITAF